MEVFCGSKRRTSVQQPACAESLSATRCNIWSVEVCAVVLMLLTFRPLFCRPFRNLDSQKSMWARCACAGNKQTFVLCGLVGLVTDTLLNMRIVGYSKMRLLPNTTTLRAVIHYILFIGGFPPAESPFAFAREGGAFVEIIGLDRQRHIYTFLEILLARDITDFQLYDFPLQTMRANQTFTRSKIEVRTNEDRSRRNLFLSETHVRREHRETLSSTLWMRSALYLCLWKDPGWIQKRNCHANS